MPNSELNEGIHEDAKQSMGVSPPGITTAATSDINKLSFAAPSRREDNRHTRLSIRCIAGRHRQGVHRYALFSFPFTA